MRFGKWFQRRAAQRQADQALKDQALRAKALEQSQDWFQCRAAQTKADQALKEQAELETRLAEESAWRATQITMAEKLARHTSSWEPDNALWSDKLISLLRESVSLDCMLLEVAARTLSEVFPSPYAKLGVWRDFEHSKEEIQDHLEEIQTRQFHELAKIRARQTRELEEFQAREYAHWQSRQVQEVQIQAHAHARAREDREYARARAENEAWKNQQRDENERRYSEKQGRRFSEKQARSQSYNTCGPNPYTTFVYLDTGQRVRVTVQADNLLEAQARFHAQYPANHTDLPWPGKY